MMIGLMESIVNDLIRSLLPVGFGTVDDQVRVEQKSPALSGTNVTAKSKLLEADGRKLLSDVCVVQDDKVIGEGVHRRIIIKVAG